MQGDTGPRSLVEKFFRMCLLLFGGVILIVLLNSVLSIMQMPEAVRQIIYGSVIVGMLLLYGRGDKETG